MLNLLHTKISFQVISIKAELFFLFFTENLVFPSLPVIHCAREKSNLPSNNKISRTVKENAIFVELILKEF